MTKTLAMFSGAAAAAFLALAGPVHAAPASPPSPGDMASIQQQLNALRSEYNAKISDLEARLKAAEARANAVAQPAAPASPPAAPVGVAPGEVVIADNAPENAPGPEAAKTTSANAMNPGV